MDGLFFFGIFTAVGLIAKKKETPAVMLLALLLPCIAAWFVYNMKFSLNISL
ncbi:MAG: hypothetical protein LBC94_10460 [Desulfovibrio sp.]|nr:hypothetical protein [Desulfovibrio sp.]